MDNFESLLIVEELNTSQIVFFGAIVAAFLYFWLRRDGFTREKGKRKFWAVIAIFAAAVVIQLYLILSLAFSAQPNVLFAIAPEGVNCSGHRNFTLALRDVQGIATEERGTGWNIRKPFDRPGHAIYIFLKPSAPRHTGEETDLDTRNRYMICVVSGVDTDSEAVKRLPGYWEKIASRQ